MGMLNIDEHVEEHRVLAIRYPDKAVMLGQIIPFTNFAPRLVASLVASSTAACVSGVVTVTATAHGITAVTFDDKPIYYPGSPSLAAGFYEKLLVIDANSFTFNAPLAADFPSESVNGGAILTAEVTVASMIIPANTFKVGDFVETLLFRRHSSTAGTKLTNLYYKTSNVGDSSSTSTSTVHCIPNMIFLCEKQASQRGVRGLPGNYTASARNGTVNIGEDNTLSITQSLTAASDWIMTYGCKVRIF